MVQTLLRCLSAISLLALIASPPVVAADRSPGRDLTEAMGFAETYVDAEALCVDKAIRTDVEQGVAKNPDLLGGIKPMDSDWTEARALYIGLLESACKQDMTTATEAFAQALDASQSVADLEALIAFYGSDLGRKLREASRQANMAAYRVMLQSVSSNDTYSAFGEAIASLLAKRTPAPEPAPKAVQALPDATAAVALSDRIMKAITGGRAREALDMLKPHTIAPDAQFDAMVEQIEQQKSTIASRFGESLDYELLRNDTIGDSLSRPVFLHRFKRSAMVWLFTWYRGDEGWVLINVRFADDANLLFR